MGTFGQTSRWFLSVLAAAVALTSDGFAQNSVRKIRRQSLSKQDALDRLGDNLSPVARRLRFRNADHLRRSLLQDPSLHLSVRPIEPVPPNSRVKPAMPDDATQAQLYFSEAALPAMTASGSELPPSATVAQIPDSTTFELHSRAGARSVLYLNFKGKSVTTEMWNGGDPINAAAYSIDGSSAFSTTELANIKAMWLQVSEDYAPFDIDVTTQPPSGNDATYFTELVITPTRWYANAGGVCYVGSFKWSDLAGKTCWIFPGALNNNNRYVADAISHEAGHAFGLTHWAEYDAAGTLKSPYYEGSSAWAPLMGTSYYAAVSTWSIGDYPNAGTTSGRGVMQDDLAVIQAAIASALPDESGSDRAGAAPIAGTAAGSQVTINQSGVITSQTDLDTFKIESTGGDLNLLIKPAGTQPNLDFIVRVLNSAGQVLSRQNPDRIANVSIALTGLARGSYFVEISSTGFGDPWVGTGYSVYGSVGRYSISGTYSGLAPAPTPPPIATPTPTPGPESNCTRDRWSSTSCGGVQRKVLRVVIQ